ncbi:MAG: 3-phosphoshikimate 1-carboxyvinyltransferase [Desulfobacteraceae bacterium 4484_190.3]|nr:MAG: 3-phosphoshikimate 1-carboxyvinyltransferase [Desulfobacteraceae bacterium 4484_190.3]
MKEIKQIKELDATVKIPGSKSYTQRALIIASLAEGKSFLRNPLISEDTKYLMDALQSLGADILVADKDIIVTGTGGNIQNPGKKLYLGNNGTALRFLTAVVSLGTGNFVLDGSDRLRERPVKPLLEALQILGVECVSTDKSGYPPVIIQGGGFQGGKTIFINAESSQYISSVLITSPYAGNDVEIELRGMTFSMPYIDMTVEIMNHFGVEVIKKGGNKYIVKAPQRYMGSRYLIESDVSSASYFFLAAVLCEGRVRVLNVNPNTLQGDIGFLEIMEKLGCHIIRGSDWVEVAGRKLNRGDYRFDMSDMPDMVPTLAVLSAFRPGQTVIDNVSHLRLKESNRIEALVTELNRIGINATELEDGLVINGGTPHSAEIETYNDHRIAMSFAIAGLVTEGIKIKNQKCVNKSFPEFWDVLDTLYE